MCRLDMRRCSMYTFVAIRSGPIYLIRNHTKRSICCFWFDLNIEETLALKLNKYLVQKKKKKLNKYLKGALSWIDFFKNTKWKIRDAVSFILLHLYLLALVTRFRIWLGQSLKTFPNYLTSPLILAFGTTQISYFSIL